MIIGSHVSYGNNGFVGCVKQSISYGANTFMFYTGAPQNTLRKSVDKKDVDDAIDLMKNNNININNVICHAPYIINLANKIKEESWDFAISFLKQEIKRCEEFGVKYIVVHPGSAVGQDRNVAIKNISEALNYIINDSTNVIVLLETMAGKGTECGKDLNELKMIIDNVIYQDKIGVCLDTCHLNDSGVNLNEFESFLNEFDKLIGIKKIKCIHVNDSLNPISSHKDRHANIGYGTIGFNTLINIIYNDKLKDVPKILETPLIGEYPPYKFEIDMINKKKFNEHLIDDVNNFYKNL